MQITKQFKFAGSTILITAENDSLLPHEEYILEEQINKILNGTLSPANNFYINEKQVNNDRENTTTQ